MKLFKKVEIEWMDAEYDKNSGWKSFDEAERWMTDKLSYKEIGYLLKKTKDYIFLISGFSQKSGIVNEICGLKSIPTGCIRKVKFL